MTLPCSVTLPSLVEQLPASLGQLTEEATAVATVVAIRAVEVGLVAEAPAIREQRDGV